MQIVKVFKNFASEQECKELNDWVIKGIENGWLDKGLSGTTKTWTCEQRYTSRRYADRFEKYPDVAYKLFDRITKLINLEGYEKSIAGGGKDGIVVSCTFPGGDVYKHQDPMEANNFHVLRCNILSSEADDGGQIYVNGEHTPINVGDLHCYLASKYLHHVTTVEGNNKRILWMFGYQIQDHDWENRYPIMELSIQ